MQRPIRKQDLTPYVRSLARRQKATATEPIWGLLEARWEALIGHAKGIAADYDGGQPMARWPHGAAVELMRVAGQATAQDAWLTACAVFMLREFDPRRFASDRAFRFQLGRCVRHLADANRGSYYDHTTGRVKVAYRDPNQRVAELIGLQIGEAFGAAGLRFAAMDEAERADKAAERMAFHAALDGVALGAP